MDKVKTVLALVGLSFIVSVVRSLMEQRHAENMVVDEAEAIAECAWQDSMREAGEWPEYG